MLVLQPTKKSTTFQKLNSSIHIMGIWEKYPMKLQIYRGMIFKFYFQFLNYILKEKKE